MRRASGRSRAWWGVGLALLPVLGAVLVQSPAAIRVEVDEVNYARPNTFADMVPLPTAGRPARPACLLVHVKLTNRSRHERRVTADQFRLAAVGEGPRQLLPPVRAEEVLGRGGLLGFTSVDVFSSRRLGAGKSTIGWLCFDIAPGTTAPTVDALRAQQPRLVFRDGLHRTGLDLTAVAGQALQTRQRASVIGPEVTVFEVPFGLNALNAQAWAQRYAPLVDQLEHKALIVVQGARPHLDSYARAALAPPTMPLPVSRTLVLPGLRPGALPFGGGGAASSLSVVGDERAAAMGMLAGLPGGRERLTALAASPDAGLRGEALRHLNETRADAERLGQALARDPDESVRRAAAETLATLSPARLGPAGVPDAVVAALRQRLGDQQGGLARCCGEAILRLDLAARLRPEIRALLQRREPTDTAVVLAGAARDPQAVPRLIQCLDDPNLTTAAAEALGGIGDRSALPALRARLKDRRSNLEAVIRAIGQLGASEDVDTLAGVLTQGGPYVDERRAAIEAVARLGGPQAAALVLRLANDHSGRDGLRETALRQLGQLNDARAVPLLEQAARQPAGDAAVAGLARMTRPEARAALRRLADDRTCPSSSEARRVLGLDS